MVKATYIRIEGKVQGVYYRQTCRSVARGLGLVGWVRNLADGSVEVLAQGDSEAVDSLVQWAWVGPSGAVVTGVESDGVSVDPNLSDFFIQPGPAHQDSGA